MMGKYDPLARQLGQTSSEEWTASFAEIERILGFSLPPSARRHRPWWSNSSNNAHSQAQSWIGAGWETQEVDLEHERVRFVRRFKSAIGNVRSGLWDRARQLTGIADQAELEHAAVRALIQQVAAQNLAMLGGTMPDASAAPRDRRPA